MSAATRALCIAVVAAAVAGGSLVGAPRAGAIIGGHPAAQGQFPFMLSLQRKTADGNAPFCGAVLIAPLTALTAAQCVGGVSPSALLVRSGSLLDASGGSLTAVTEIIRYPGYDSDTEDNDIAVLHLAALGSDLVPALLPPPGEDPQSGTEVDIAGWGITQSPGAPSARLLTARMPVVGRSQCNAEYKEATGGDDAISEQMVCAGVPAGGVGSCRGDWGGPVLQGATVVGIISWSKGCAEPDLPSVNARVGSFVTWILAHLA
jgi:trypsin